MRAKCYLIFIFSERHSAKAIQLVTILLKKNLVVQLPIYWVLMHLEASSVVLTMNCYVPLAS